MNNMATVPESTVPELPPNPDGQENYEPVEEQRPATANAPPRPPGPGRFRRMSTAALGPFARNRGGGGAPGQMSQLPPELEYDPRIVDLLDVIGWLLKALGRVRADDCQIPRCLLLRR